MGVEQPQRPTVVTTVTTTITRRRRSLLEQIGLVLTAVLLACVCVALGGAVIYLAMRLWNWLVPSLFHGPRLTYWQAVGLWVLLGIIASVVTGSSSKSKG